MTNTTGSHVLSLERFDILPFVILLSMHLLALWGLTQFTLISFFAFIFSYYLFAILGASITLHHYLSHQSFRFRSRKIKLFCLFLGTICLQGTGIYWASHHRYHHRFADQVGDPHSRRRGFWWAHMGWLIHKNPNGCLQQSAFNSCRDLVEDKDTLWFDRHYLMINLLFLLILGGTCYIFQKPEFFFAVGPVRVVAVWHSTWLINSYAHTIKSDEVILREKSGLLTFLMPGEANHLWHHARVRQSFYGRIGAILLKLDIVKTIT